MMYGYPSLVSMNQRVFNKLSKKRISEDKLDGTWRAHGFHDCIYILRPSYFCEIWALSVLWITYGHLYYNPFLDCWALVGSLVLAMCNGISCSQVHELPQSHFGDNRGHSKQRRYKHLVKKSSPSLESSTIPRSNPFQPKNNQAFTWSLFFGTAVIFAIKKKNPCPTKHTFVQTKALLNNIGHSIPT